ncbi:MAG TPA: hypothetical protein VKV17_16715 [Bryobacteraceae bacterium]|nr:hypothetical protein [Bryobacteraceae bacterium]
MTPNSAWTVAQTPIATAPPNAAYVIIYAFYQPGTNSCSGTWYIDNVVFRPAVDASMVSSVNASSITGFITAGQISQVSASSIIGLILANQISSVSAASITGQLQASQIGHVSASSISGQIVASQISTVSAASIQGTINASNIGLIAASQISGQISANQIGTINASQINIGAGAAGTIDVTNTLTFSGAGGIEFAGNGGINIGGAGGLSITGTGGVTIWNGDLSLTNGVLSAVETTVAYYYSFGGFYALTTPNLVTTLKIQNGYNGNYYGQIVFSNQIADDIIELYSGYTIGIRSGTLFFQSQNQFQFNTPGGPSTGSFLIGYTGELTSYNPSTVQGGYGSGGQNFYRTLYPGSYSGYTGFVDAGIAGVGYADFGANETGPRYFTMQFVNGLFVGFQ